MLSKCGVNTFAVIVCGVYAVPALSVVHSEYTVGLNTEWIDNVFNRSYNRIHDTKNRLYLDIALNSDEREVTQYGMDYSISHESYLRDSFDRNNYFEGSGFLNLHLYPNRVYWRNSVSSAVTLRDSVSTNTPDNRDQRNNFSTSLDYFAISSRRDNLSISTSVNATQFREASQNDNSRYGLSVVWDHSLNSLLSAGASCNANVVEFDVVGNYKSYLCTVNVDQRLNNGDVLFNVGKRLVNPEAGAEIDGLYYSLQFNWQSGPNDISIRTNRDVTDTTVSFADLEFSAGAFTPVDINSDVLALVARTRTQLNYRYEFTGLTSVSTTAYRDSEDLYNSDQDTDRDGVTLSLNHALTADLDLDVSYSFERNEFAPGSPNQTVDYSNRYQLSASKTFTRHLVIVGYLGAENRKAERDVQEYETYSIGLDLAYTF
jgi:hypothetical protein